MKSYLIGFIGSLLVTLLAYFCVVHSLYDGWTLVYVLTALACIQVIIQLRYFLHLGDEPRPYWNLLVFLFMLIILLAIVLGSLWIMQNLNYRDMG